MNNKVVNFWMRFLIKLINFFPSIFLIIIISFLWKINIKKITLIQYYIQLLIFGFSILFFNYILPILTNGYSLGNLITNTKIIFHDKNKLLSLFKKEFFLSLSFFISSLLFLAFVGKDLFIKISTKNVDNLSLLNNFNLAIVSSWTSVSMIFQMIIIINLIVKKENNWIDKWSKTQIIYTKKFVEIKLEKKITIKPQMIKNEIIEWI